MHVQGAKREMVRCESHHQHFEENKTIKSTHKAHVGTYKLCALRMGPGSDSAKMLILVQVAVYFILRVLQGHHGAQKPSQGTARNHYIICSGFTVLFRKIANAPRRWLALKQLKWVFKSGPYIHVSQRPILLDSLSMRELSDGFIECSLRMESSCSPCSPSSDAVITHSDICDICLLKCCIDCRCHRNYWR